MNLEKGFLLTTNQLAAILQVEPETIRTWVNRGKIPDAIVFKLPNTKKGTVRFITSKVYLWLSGELA